MHDMKELKSNIRKEIGSFSKMEFRNVYMQTTRTVSAIKSRGNNNGKWYLVVFIGESIRQNWFSFYCQTDFQTKKPHALGNVVIGLRKCHASIISSRDGYDNSFLLKQEKLIKITKTCLGDLEESYGRFSGKL